MSTEEATVNPDGSTTFESSEDAGDVPPPNTDAPGDGPFGDDDETIKDALVASGTDPALYLGLVVLLIAAMAYYIWYSNKKQNEDDFFSELDGDKFNLKLPDAVDEYYEIKAKCVAAGWEPGQSPGPGAANQGGPHRTMAQALMKRCIADIPIVTHIQKESAGMNKLYAQSMCSVRQWRAYQAAEALVSGEVDQVRAEADEIEPGWSQVIWRQAMQYHEMLKKKHETEAKATAEAAAKKKQIEANVEKAKKARPPTKEEQEAAAARAAEALIKEEEEQERSKKTSFSEGSGMKKGFLASSSGKKK